MSKKTRARRYDVPNYKENEIQQLIGHLISKTQPQRRIFLGKTEGFKDKEEQKFFKKMLKAYLKGAEVFYHGTRPKEIIRFKYNKDSGKHDIPVNTGVFEEVPQGHVVKQMYFFN